MQIGVECSLPSIVTPMRDKSQVLRIVGMAFVSIIIVYLFLFVSCGLAFGTWRLSLIIGHAKVINVG